MNYVYLTHPDHGTHIAYTQDEIDRCLAEGWKLKVSACEEDKPVASAEVERAVLHLPEKRGRPRPRKVA
jgi:hypothetical protein